MLQTISPPTLVLSRFSFTSQHRQTHRFTDTTERPTHATATPASVKCLLYGDNKQHVCDIVALSKLTMDVSENV